MTYPRRIQSAILWVSLLPSLFISVCSETCDFGNGNVFEEGEPLGDLFTTRCGSAADFPCYCDPDALYSVNCPYCGVSTEGGGLECPAVNGDPVSLINLEGISQTCSCYLNDEDNPELLCVNNDDDAPVASPTTQDVCVIEYDDGTVLVFDNGESYGDLYTTRCGSSNDFPCYCDTSVTGKISCPYCTEVTNTGDLSCGYAGGSFALTNTSNVAVVCDCDDNLVPTCREAAAPTVSPTMAPIPTPAPVVNPTSSPTRTPSAIPTEQPVTTTVPPFFGTFPPAWSTDVPTQSPSANPSHQTPAPTIATRAPSNPLPTISKPSILTPTRTPPVQQEGCYYEIEGSSELGFVSVGEEINSDLLEGPCSPSSSYPAICNPDLPGSIEYPYCVFSSDGEVSDFMVCAKSETEVTVVTNSGTATCSCLYLNSALGPVSTCPDLLVDVSLALTVSPSAMPSAAPTTPWPTTQPTTPVPSTESPTAGAGTKGLSILLMIGMAAVCLVL